MRPRPLTGDTDIDCGLAGTVMRFLPPVAGLASGRSASTGTGGPGCARWGPRMGALRALGVDCRRRPAGALPFTITGRGSVRGGEVTLDASASSQFVSALLLAGSRFRDGVTVHHVGEPIPSQPHIDMTVEVLRDAGRSSTTATPTPGGSSRASWALSTSRWSRT